MLQPSARHDRALLACTLALPQFDFEAREPMRIGRRKEQTYFLRKLIVEDTEDGLDSLFVI